MSGQCVRFLLEEGNAVSWFPTLFLLHPLVPSRLVPVSMAYFPGECALSRGRLQEEDLACQFIQHLGWFRASWECRGQHGKDRSGLSPSTN